MIALTYTYVKFAATVLQNDNLKRIKINCTTL